MYIDFTSQSEKCQEIYTRVLKLPKLVSIKNASINTTLKQLYIYIYVYIYMYICMCIDIDMKVEALVSHV